MMRLVAVAGNSCLTIRSLIVLLTICWLVEVRLPSGPYKSTEERRNLSLDTTQKEAATDYVYVVQKIQQNHPCGAREKNKTCWAGPG